MVDSGLVPARRLTPRRFLGLAFGRRVRRCIAHDVGDARNCSGNRR